jgi:hypothetical protein
MTEKKVLYIVFILLILSLCAYNWHGDIQDVLTYGWSDWPTHEPPSVSCPWKREVFKNAGLSAFLGNCIDKRAYDPTNGYAMVFSDSNKEIIGTWVTNSSYEFTIQVFDKTASENPLDVVKGWYAELTSDQQKVCTIQNADEPVDHFSNGTINWTEDPHPEQHKTRYKIDIKPEISQQIMANSEPGDPKYDYMCGHLVGTTFSGHPPYFEFDDRSPDKYLMVGTYGPEGPLLDLNSIRF